MITNERRLELQRARNARREPPQRVEACIRRRPQSGMYVVEMEGFRAVACAELAEARRVREEQRSQREPGVRSAKGGLWRGGVLTLAGVGGAREYRAKNAGNARSIAQNRADVARVVSVLPVVKGGGL